MSELNDCPYAFPREEKDPYMLSQKGMTLRQYFAGQALAGLMARILSPEDAVAKLAYKMADEMLKYEEQKT